MSSQIPIQSKIHFNPLEDIHDLEIKTLLETFKSQFNIDEIGVTELNRPLTIDQYKNWLDQDNAADMNYLKEHFFLKETPQLIHSEIRTSITILQNYYPAPQPSLKTHLRTALYSQNTDYHYWVKTKLKQIIENLQKIYPYEVFIPFVDSGPVLERDLAYRSGLGWFGKNTCLISHKHGSLFFIAEILTSKIISKNQITFHHDLCGTCTKCIDICPTQALTEKNLNANKCISYLTIESKKNPPEPLRKLMGDWFFGCDLCQTVCPWNQKKIKLHHPQIIEDTFKTTLQLSELEQTLLINDLNFLFSASNKQIQKKYINTPLLRAGANGLKRNALIIVANRQLLQFKPFIQKLTDHMVLGELAVWTLNELQYKET